MDDPKNRYASSDFQPYALTLGQLALAWNDLQEELCNIFTTIMGPLTDAGTMVNTSAISAWASVRSDRSQRLMLKAVAENPPWHWQDIPKWQDEVIWLVNRANELEDSRNNAIHSPLISFGREGLLSALSMYLRETEEYVIPKTWNKNFRALNLSAKRSILEEFQYCRDSAIQLGDYSEFINGFLMNRSRSWRERPSLPNRVPKKIRCRPQSPAQTKQN